MKGSSQVEFLNASDPKVPYTSPADTYTPGLDYFTLENYPNPFNHSTAIKYHVKEFGLTN